MTSYRMSLIRHRRRTFLLCKEQGDLNAKVGRDACGNWQSICGSFCNDDTNERGLRLLEFATFNDLVLANTFGHHEASRRWTLHSPNGQHHNQIDYTLVRKCFWSGVNSTRTQSPPGADIGSDHDLLMMTFRLRLKRISKPKHTRLEFDLEKLKYSNVLETFQVMIGKFTLLTIMNNEHTDLNSMITTFNTAVIETASEIHGRHRQKKKTLGHCRNSWSVRQKERSEKETNWTWRIWEIQVSELLVSY